MAEDHCVPRSGVAELDRQIEEAIGRIMAGKPRCGDYGLVADLSSRRVEITEPLAFQRIEEALGVKIAWA
jgi:hypothetical protein